jgi:hypothetical protein
MTKALINKSKDKSFKLSDQVKAILQEKGYSTLFNHSDYLVFKKAAKNNFNKALDIAEYFILENQDKSDYHGYIF